MIRLSFSLIVEIFVAALLTQILIILASDIDLNTEDILNSTDLPADIEVFWHHIFQKLKQPTRCSYSNLTRCHNDAVSYYTYYDSCYSSVCNKEDYYCRNNPNGNTDHICGKGDECQKRRRNLAVYDPNNKNIINVYSVACPVGYFQPNMKICFDRCVKDPSITVLKIEDGEPPVARCSSEEGYCNEKRETDFYIGSGNDTCVLARMDLGIRCEKGKELMPDCSCVKVCQVNEERDFNGSLKCMPKQLTSTIAAYETTEVNVNEITEHSSNASRLTTDSTSGNQFTNHSHLTSDTLNNRKDTSEEKIDSIKSRHDVLIDALWLVVILVVTIAVIAITIAIAVIVWKFLSRRQEDARKVSPDLESPGTCTKVQTRNIGGTFIHVGEKAKHVSVNIPSGEPSKMLNAISDTEDDCSSKQANTLLEPLIQNLESYVNQDEGNESGFDIQDETAVKCIL